MFNRQVVNDFLQKNPAVIAVGMAAILAGVFFAVEQSAVLPLEGQAMPTYGALPTGKAPTVRKTVSVQKPTSFTAVRRAARDAKHAAAPQASSRAVQAASSSSSVAKVWTGNECETRPYAGTLCEMKTKATLQGDPSCFADEKCNKNAWMCYLGREDCAAIQKRYWAFNVFFPECLETRSEDCMKGVEYLASKDAPKALQDCLKSTICAELLASFRKGDFVCRRYSPCQDALESLVQNPWCDQFKWCDNMRTINDIYSKDWQKCPSIEGADCKDKLGLKPFISTAERRVKCHDDINCKDAVTDLAESLNHYQKYNLPNAACFLWPECKDEFSMDKRWACETVKREPNCTRVKNVWKLLTETNKSCVTSGETATCQALLKQALQ